MVEQTSSNFKVSGKVIIDKSTIKDLGWMKQLFFQVKSREDNLVPLNMSAKKTSKMNINVKKDKEEKNATKVSAYDGIDLVKDSFTNNDFVFIAGHVEYDDYRKDLVLNPTTVYKASDKDFKDEKFVEQNLVQQEIVFDSMNGKKLKGMVITYFGQICEVEFDIEDEDIINELKKLKYGDLITINWERVKTPVYAKNTTSSTGKTIGKSYGSEKTSKFPKVESYMELKLVVGLEIDKTLKGKYDRKTLRDAQEEYENKQAEYVNNKPSAPATTQDDEEDDILPY